MSEFRLVPLLPVEAQWNGLARDVVMWMVMGGRPTGEALHSHLRRLGQENIPAWLVAEIPDSDHVPPKGTMAAVIYRLMVEAAPAFPQSKE